jgi:hypothetical protein
MTLGNAEGRPPTGMDAGFSKSWSGSLMPSELIIEFSFQINGERRAPRIASFDPCIVYVSIPQSTDTKCASSNNAQQAHGVHAWSLAAIPGASS